MSKLLKIIIVISIILAILTLDQWSKLWVYNNMIIGQTKDVFSWFKIHYVENNGFAFGMQFGGRKGKLLLTLLRIVASGLILYYIITLIKRNRFPIGYIIAITLIFTGAVGNIVDSVFYGVWFNYDDYFYGSVIDMLYCPIINMYISESIPLIGGEHFVFFRPIFNVADSSVTIGVLIVILFFRKYLSKLGNKTKAENENYGKC